MKKRWLLCSLQNQQTIFKSIEKYLNFISFNLLKGNQDDLFGSKMLTQKHFWKGQNMNYFKSTVVTAATTLLQLILWIFSIIISFVRFPREISKCKKTPENLK